MNLKSKTFKSVCWIITFALVLPANLHAEDWMVPVQKGNAPSNPAKSVSPSVDGKSQELPSAPVRPNIKVIPPSTEPAGPLQPPTLPSEPGSSNDSGIPAAPIRSTGNIPPAPGSTNNVVIPTSNPGETFINVPATPIAGVPSGGSNMVLAGVNTTPNQFPNSSEGVTEGFEFNAANNVPGTPAGGNLTQTLTQDPSNYVFSNSGVTEGFTFTAANNAPGTPAGGNLTQTLTENPSNYLFSNEGVEEDFHFVDGNLVPILGGGGTAPLTEGGNNDPVSGTGEPVLPVTTPVLEPTQPPTIEPPTPPTIETITRIVTAFVDGTILTDDEFDNRDIPVRYRISGSSTITETWQVNADGTRVLLSSSGSESDFNPAFDCVSAPCTLTLFQSIGAENAMLGVFHTMQINNYRPDDAYTGVKFTALSGHPFYAVNSTSMGIDSLNRLYFEENFLAAVPESPSGAAATGFKRTYIGAYQDPSTTEGAITLLRYSEDFFRQDPRSRYPRLTQTNAGGKFFRRPWENAITSGTGTTKTFGSSPSQFSLLENGQSVSTQDYLPAFDREITIAYTPNEATYNLNFQDLNVSKTLTIPAGRYHDGAVRDAGNRYVTSVTIHLDIDTGFGGQRGFSFKIEIVPLTHIIDQFPFLGILRSQPRSPFFARDELENFGKHTIKFLQTGLTPDRGGPGQGSDGSSGYSATGGKSGSSGGKVLGGGQGYSRSNSDTGKKKKKK